MTTSKRFLGLELGGSRRTSAVALDFHPEENRVYHFATRAHLHGTKELTADEAVANAVNELKPDLIAVDAPLTFPPCFDCDCEGECDKPEVKWMREESERRRWSKAKYPPPYTHRPVDLLARGRWQDDSPTPVPADEAFGSGRAPLAARISFLRRRFGCTNLIEASPRFALAGLVDWYGVSVRELRRARDFEHGAENRFTILNKMAERTQYAELPQLHLFMTEVVAIAKDIDAFDAFLCALTGIFAEVGLVEPLEEIDPATGWIVRPRKRGYSPEARA